MNKLTKYAIIAIACSLPFTVSAKTPDKMTPSVETVCSHFQDEKGPAFGLCNAYCEAMDCGDPAQHSDQRACDRVNNNFEKHTGLRLPEANYVEPTVDQCVIVPQ